MYIPGPWDSLSHLVIDDDPLWPWFISAGLLAALIGVTCWLFPCLPVAARCKDHPFHGSQTVKITSLHVYPVKSCAGHSVPSARLVKTGLYNDRRWMVVNERGSFMSQRRLPKLAKIRPSLPARDDEPLVLRAENMPDLSVPVVRAQGGADIRKSNVWGDPVEGVDQGDAAAAWLQKFLGSSEGQLRLVRMDESFSRQTDPAFGGRGNMTAFADGFPLLLAAEESLAELNRRLGPQETIPMNRFRPNVVVAGAGPFEEDTWTELRVNGVALRPIKAAARCKIPTINQDTLEMKAEPTRTLKDFRTGGLLFPNWPGVEKDVFFAQNLVHSGSGRLSVGDKVTLRRVLKRHCSAGSLAKKDE